MERLRKERVTVMEDWEYLCIALIEQANITNEDIDIIINEVKGDENA